MDDAALRKQIRILEQRLWRSEQNRARLEDGREEMAALHHNVMSQLQTSEAEAVKANRAKSRFLANMSHEIRTPLSGVIGTADLLLRSKLNDEQLELAITLKDASQVLLTLLDDVLDFSKIEAGQLALVDAAFRPFELLQACGRLHRTNASRKNVELHILDEGLPAAVMGDAGRVRQILANLLANAVKFTERGSIRAVGRACDGGIEFEVTDTGIGIPTALHQAVFDAFRQQDDSNTRRFGGTGLGLPISRDLARRMGGDVSLESTPGVGTIVRVRLMLPEIAEASVVDGLHEVTLQLSGLQVLLAEDSAVNRMVAEKLLARLGCKVTSVDDGLKAVRAFDDRFDAVLLDCQMPVLDGISAAVQIRQHSDVPIVAITASVLADDRDRCIEAGMNGFLSKPFTLNALADILRRVTQ